MLIDQKVWVGNSDHPVYLLANKANRHGLIAGATGTGKTVTLKVLAESFSDMGVPVFIADVKGDVAGLSEAGVLNEDMKERIERFHLDENFSLSGYPVTLWDLFGQSGIPLRTTISEMGPLLLARVLELNELQSDVLSVAFKIADDQNLLLVDTKDLKALLTYINDNSKTFEADYGKISSATIGVIIRAIVALETQGGDQFFKETALSISDFLTFGEGGKGMIHILDSESLINNGKLYSTFLLWLLSELFETLPEVGDLEKPKMIFFFDEAHLLFKGTSKALLEKIEQVVKLIRSKGVGIYFCTQNPRDIPDGVLAQLGNKIQHGLRAYTPADQKAVKAAAESFRENPDLNSYETILNLGTGEALVSFLDEKGIPEMAEKISILPPRSSFTAITQDKRTQLIHSSLLYSKYAKSFDPDSAYEFLSRIGLEAQAKKEQEKADQVAQKEAMKKEKEAQKEREKEARAKKRAVQSVGSTLLGTLCREAGKAAGGKFGKFGQRLGGNLGAQLGRSILGTLFKK